MSLSSFYRDFSLSDIFNSLGMRLYGSEWNGSEIWGRKAEDPAQRLEARAPLEAWLGEVSSFVAAKQRELRDAIGKDKINQINFEIEELRNEQGDLFHKLALSEQNFLSAESTSRSVPG